MRKVALRAIRRLRDWFRFTVWIRLPFYTDNITYVSTRDTPYSMITISSVYVARKISKPIIIDFRSNRFRRHRPSRHRRSTDVSTITPGSTKLSVGRVFFSTLSYRWSSWFLFLHPTFVRVRSLRNRHHHFVQRTTKTHANNLQIFRWNVLSDFHISHIFLPTPSKKKVVFR